MVGEGFRHPFSHGPRQTELMVVQLTSHIRHLAQSGFVPTVWSRIGSWRRGAGVSAVAGKEVVPVSAP